VFRSLTHSCWPSCRQALQNQSTGDALWMAPAASAGVQLSAARPPGLMVAQPTASGAMAGLSVMQQQLLASGVHAAPQAGGVPVGGLSNPYQARQRPMAAHCWTALDQSLRERSAAAQGEVALRDQLLTEVGAASDRPAHFKWCGQGQHKYNGRFERLRYLTTASVTWLPLPCSARLGTLQCSYWR